MADYKYINDKDISEVKCLCGNTVGFRILGTNDATMCKCGLIVLRSSVNKEFDSKEPKANKSIP